MNDVIAWTTEKWLTNTTTGGQGTVIWYYVARYDRTEEVHILFRFYESISPLEHPKLSTKKADLELRVRRSISKELTSYHLFEKEEKWFETHPILHKQH